MAAIWAILAKTRFPAEIIASSKERGVYSVDLPFDLTADYLPKQRKAVSHVLQNEFIRGDKLALNQQVLRHTNHAQPWEIETQRHRV